MTGATWRRWIRGTITAACLLAAMIPTAWSASASARVSTSQSFSEQEFTVNVPGLPLWEALERLADQMPGLQLSGFSRNQVWLAKVRTLPVYGRYRPDDALRKMLDGTGVRHELHGSFVSFSRAESKEDASTRSAIPSVLIEGKRSLNNQGTRTNDSALATFVLKGDDLRAFADLSAATFLQDNLSAHVRSAVPASGGAIAGGSDQINLLALGASQTSVKIDGQLLAQTGPGGVTRQPNIGMLPPSSIDRIELQLGAASSEAGPGAAGGAVNINRKRAKGTHLIVSADRYAESAADAALLSLEHGIDLPRQGWLSLSASLSWQDRIRVSQRNRLSEGRRTAGDRNPALTAFPPLGEETNVASVSGTPLLPGGRFPHLSVPADWDGDLAKLQERDGQYNYGLAATSQDRGGRNATLQPARRSLQVNTAGKIPFDDSWSADFDVGFAKEDRWGDISFADDVLERTYFLAADDPNNRFGQDILVTAGSPWGDGTMTSEQQSGYITGALSYRFASDGKLRFSQSVSRAWAWLTRPSLTISDGAPNSAGGGVLGRRPFNYSLEDVQTPRVSAVLEDSSLLYSMPILRQGDSKRTDPSFSLTAQRQYQVVQNPDALLSATLGGTPGSGASSMPERAQTMLSLRGEIIVPFYLSESTEPTLETSVSARGYAYRVSLPDSAVKHRDFNILSESVALGWRPSDWLLLRSSYSTGFVPVALEMLTQPVEQSVSQLPIADPLRPGELIGPVRLTVGGNLDLDPEKARTYRVGFVVTLPEDWLRLSLDFTRVQKANAIVGSEDLLFADSNAFMSQFPTRIVRAATTDGSVGRIVSIDASATNVARQDVRALELSVLSKWNFGARGTFRLLSYGTYVSAFERRIAPGFPEIDNAGVVTLGPPHVRANASLVYSLGSWDMGAKTRFTSRNRVSRDESAIASQGGRSVGSQMYHDLFVAHSGDAPFSSDLSMTWRLEARNVFRHRAPYNAAELYYSDRYGDGEQPLYRVSVGIDF